jgi:exodeoxyribonuclease-3
MKIATWNVNGIRARQAEVGSWIAAERPDVVCLQEIKATNEQIPPELREIDGYWCYWHGGAKGYSGVALHVAKSLTPEPPVFSHPPFDHEARIVTAAIVVPAAGTGGLVPSGLAAASRLTVASAYVPNGGKDLAAKIRFLDGLIGFAESFGAAAVEPVGPHLVVCGDLNVARAEIDVHPKDRNPRAIGQLPQERERFERLLGHGLGDVARRLDPTNEQLFTWWAPWRNLRQRNLGWRIDYVLASEALAARAVSCVAHREYGTSDHAPVVARFED